jgi:hypothetical protein
MSRKLRSVFGLGLATVACAATAATASADGLPVPFDGGDNTGVASLDGGFRYATVAAGRDTVAVRTATGTGEIQRTVQLRGDWGVPLVAYDGTPGGLSADGETLTLIRPRTRFPRETTTFAFLDAERLRVRDQLTLRGDFSFDALSPDGRVMYLIQYTDPRDPTAYEVRAYDLERDRLLADPIVDPEETGEEMAGFPQTRALSPDGRWAYTLYDPVEGNHPPFIHALDTQRGTAVCIDLDALADHRKIWQLGLQPSPDGSTLGVIDRGAPVAIVDLDSFEVSTPEPPTASAAESGGDEDGMPWALIVGGGALLIVAGSLIAIRRRPDRVDERELERLVELHRTARDEEDAREREPVG